MKHKSPYSPFVSPGPVKHWGNDLSHIEHVGIIACSHLKQPLRYSMAIEDKAHCVNQGFSVCVCTI